MANYSDAAFQEKLSKLVDTQESIETVSAWAVFHRKKHAEIVSTWNHEYLRAPASRKLAFLYLANDIIQRSRKVGGEFIREFSSVMTDAMQQAYQSRAAPVERLKRMLDVWQDRRVYPVSYVNGIRAHLGLPLSTEADDSPLPAPTVTPHSTPTFPSLPTHNQNSAALLAALLPPLSTGAPPAGNEVDSQSYINPNVAKQLADILEPAKQLEESAMAMEMLKDRIEMIRPELASGAELQAKHDAGDDAGMATLLDELEDDVNQINDYEAAIQTELKRRSDLLAALAAAVDREETRINDLGQQLQQAIAMKTSARETLESHRRNGQKRQREEAELSSLPLTEGEPAAKIPKLNDDSEAPASAEPAIPVLDMNFLSQLQQSLTSLQGAVVPDAAEQTDL